MKVQGPAHRWSFEWRVACYLFHLLHQTFHLLVRRSSIKFHIDWFRIANCVFSSNKCISGVRPPQLWFFFLLHSRFKRLATPALNNAGCVSIHVLPLSLPVIYTITLFLLPKTHVATRATAFTRFIALCAHTFLLSTWAKLRIAFDPDSHNTNTTSPHTTKIQSYLNISIKPITTYLCSEYL